MHRYYTVEQQYGELPGRVAALDDKLTAVDAASGDPLTVMHVERAATEAVAMSRGQRFSRIVVNGQRKGTEDVNAVYHGQQGAFFFQIGHEGLPTTASFRTSEILHHQD